MTPVIQHLTRPNPSQIMKRKNLTSKQFFQNWLVECRITHEIDCKEVQFDVPCAKKKSQPHISGFMY